MARPSYSQTRNQPPRGGNPLTGWLAERRERKARLAEEAAREITNDLVENENRLIETLRNINFLHSKLPPALLNYRKNEDQPCGDLEYFNLGLIQTLEANNQSVSIDIRPVDERILQLAKLFRRYIEEGSPKAAYAARSALHKAVTEVRRSVPESQPELAKQYVEVYSRYLEEWITLVELSRTADELQKSRDTQAEELKRQEEKTKAQREGLRQTLTKDARTLELVSRLANHDSPLERSHWTQEERALHRTLVEKRMLMLQTEVNERKLQELEFRLSATESRIATLHTKIAAVPIVTDENLMNKYQESVDALFEELARSDAEIDETLRTLDEIDGRLQQLDESAGSQRMREVACDMAQTLLDELRAREQERSPDAELRARQLRQELGLFNAEEEQRERQSETEEQAEYQEN